MGSRRILLVGIVTFALLLSGCTAIGGCGTPIPDVKGKTATQAEEALVAAGFKVGRVTYDSDADGAPGAVVAQDPAAGTKSQAGTIVNLTVAGAAPTKVPSVLGLTKDAAATALASASLTLGAATESFSSTAAAGVVMSQDPSAGAEVAGDSAVDVVVSKGAEPVTPPPPPAEPAKVKVPAVKGIKLAIAKDKLEAVGLKWDHELGPGDGMTDVGFVYKQVPTAGTIVDVGSVVTIITWKGP